MLLLFLLLLLLLLLLFTQPTGSAKEMAVPAQQVVFPQLVAPIAVIPPVLQQPQNSPTDQDVADALAHLRLLQDSRLPAADIAAAAAYQTQVIHQYGIQTSIPLSSFLSDFFFSVVESRNPAALAPAWAQGLVQQMDEMVHRMDEVVGQVAQLTQRFDSFDRKMNNTDARRHNQAITRANQPYVPIVSVDGQPGNGIPGLVAPRAGIAPVADSLRRFFRQTRTH